MSSTARFFALPLALVLFGLFVLCSGVNPLDVYSTMLRGAFGTEYSWRSTMIHAAPLYHLFALSAHEIRKRFLDNRRILGVDVVNALMKHRHHQRFTRIV